jgi:hypothetical protein
LGFLTGSKHGAAIELLDHNNQYMQLPPVVDVRDRMMKNKDKDECECDTVDLEKQQSLLRQLQLEQEKLLKTAESVASPTSPNEIAETLRNLVGGAARVSRDDFITEFDLGVPWDETQTGAKDVLMLYSGDSALPPYHNNNKNKNNNNSGGWPSVSYSSAKDATANCETMKVVLIKPVQAKQCLAIVPQWESFHVHRFMRWRDDANNRSLPAVSMQYSLKHVSRHHQSNGKGPEIPNKIQTKRYLPMLIDYIQKLDATLERLKPIAAQAVNKQNKIIVMVCNFGQSELFLNFVCSARARGLDDLSHVLLFATDTEMYDLATSLGIINVFDVQDAFGDDMPKDAAKAYGDRSFRGMMMSKVYCVHQINALGYDVLFQDVDVVWYKNPLAYFDSPEAGNFDLYFQDGK